MVSHMQKVLALALLCACFAAVPMKAQTPAVWYPTSNASVRDVCHKHVLRGFLVVPAGITHVYVPKRNVGASKLGWRVIGL